MIQHQPPEELLILPILAQAFKLGLGVGPIIGDDGVFHRVQGAAEFSDVRLEGIAGEISADQTACERTSEMITERI